MPIDWKSPDSYTRLLAAMCAAQGGNVDFKKVAYFYGKGATYDAIEGRFRIAKKEAKKLEEEAKAECREMPATRTKSANSTPRKPKAKPSTEGVKSGRVGKSSPTKKKVTVIKTETDSSSSAAHTPSSVDSELLLSQEASPEGLLAQYADFDSLAGMYSSGIDPYDITIPNEM